MNKEYVKTQKDTENLLLKEKQLKETTTKINNYDDIIADINSQELMRKAFNIIAMVGIIPYNILLGATTNGIFSSNIAFSHLLAITIINLLYVSIAKVTSTLFWGKDNKTKINILNNKKVELKREIEQIKKDIQELKKKPDITTHRQTIKPITNNNYPIKSFTKRLIPNKGSNH